MKKKNRRIKQQPYSFMTLLFVVALIFHSSCGDDQQKTEYTADNIIAIIGKDTIFVDDFLNRSELTVRPQYCDNNKNSDKGIILNSLIAEHLIAVEAEKDNPFVKNPIYNAKILGIKEQLMREKLIHDEIVNKINISQAEIDEAYINSRRTFQIEMLLIPSIYDPNEIYDAANKGVLFDDITKKYPGVSQKETKNICWGKIDKVTQDAIFNKKVKEGKLLKPIRTESGYRLIRVITWIQNIEMSAGNITQQREKIKTKLKEIKINEQYGKYVKNVMQNVKIDLTNEGWEIIYDALLPIYVDEIDTYKSYNSIESTEKMRMGNETVFFNIDNHIWTIKDFIEAVRIHPLEISKKNISKDNFEHRLRSAISSLITDTYLTKIAYEKSFDKAYEVTREVKQWERYYNFTYEQNKYLVEKGYHGKLSTDYKFAFTKHLNPWYDSLKRRYDDIIVYNPNALEAVKLTKIPLVLYKSKGPYINAVPAFPVTTDQYSIGFRKMKQIQLWSKNEK